MVYNELPSLEDVISDDPFLNQCISECQAHSNEFYDCLTTTENAIRDSVVSGKEYNKYVRTLSVALEDAAEILPAHNTALEKVILSCYLVFILIVFVIFTLRKTSLNPFPATFAGLESSGN